MATKAQIAAAYRQGRADAAALIWTNLSAMQAAPSLKSMLSECIDRAAQGDRWDPQDGWAYDTTLTQRAVRLIEESA